MPFVILRNLLILFPSFFLLRDHTWLSLWVRHLQSLQLKIKEKARTHNYYLSCFRYSGVPIPLFICPCPCQGEDGILCPSSFSPVQEAGFFLCMFVFSKIVYQVMPHKVSSVDERYLFCRCPTQEILQLQDRRHCTPSIQVCGTQRWEVGNQQEGRQRERNSWHLYQEALEPDRKAKEL